MTQTTALRFGILQIPAGTETYTVSTTGATSGSGTYLYGVVADGVYSIKCQQGGGCTTIDIDVQTSALGCTGLTNLGAYMINYNNGEYVGTVPKTGLSNPNGAKTLTVGSTATYSGSVGAGNCTPAINIVVTGH